ncbi:hypothetical protein QR680_010727 [Steinernema hermaphroditum]|uniref:SAM domain-containing protein n=1 Tax=Steinernema hermaphroditum TaxID=289476 RepID=A0AA39IPY4_9BILA|nr:hypothetical protein QR680_010727 [Steinernema hermaphroditum]
MDIETSVLEFLQAVNLTDCYEELVAHRYNDMNTMLTIHRPTDIYHLKLSFGQKLKLCKSVQAYREYRRRSFVPIPAPRPVEPPRFIPKITVEMATTAAKQQRTLQKLKRDIDRCDREIAQVLAERRAYATQELLRP